MRRPALLLLLVAATLLGVGCQLMIVTGKTVEESPDGPRVCLTYRYSGEPDQFGSGTRTCVDWQGAPLTMRCYRDAAVGDRPPDACIDGRLSDRALTIRAFLRGVEAFLPFLALVLGVGCGVAAARLVGGPGWRATAAGFTLVGVSLGASILSYALLWVLSIVAWGMFAY